MLVNYSCTNVRVTVHTDILIQYHHLPVYLLSVISHYSRFCSVLCQTRSQRRYGENITGMGTKMERFCAFQETFGAILETFCVLHVIKFFESLWIFCAFHGTFCTFCKTFCVFQHTICEFQERFCVFR